MQTLKLLLYLNQSIFNRLKLLAILSEPLLIALLIRYITALERDILIIGGSFLLS